MTRNTPPNDNGLSLIELTVALFIFALIAVMGLQALTGMLRMQDRLVDLDQDVGDIGHALTLLRSDMSAIVPVVFYPPNDTPKSAIELSSDGRIFSFSSGGQPDLSPVDGIGLHRIEWRYNAQEQSLNRRIWPVLEPAVVSAAQPEVAVLTGVSGMTLRSYWPETGWRTGVDFLGEDIAEIVTSRSGVVDLDTVLRTIPNSYGGVLPIALEVTIETDEYGSIALVESLR